MGYLFIIDANKDNIFETSAKSYIHYGQAEVAKQAAFIDNISVEESSIYGTMYLPTKCNRINTP